MASGYSMSRSYLQEIEEQILEHLRHRPLTILDLCELLQMPYTTVQQVHKKLREDGKITKFDRKARGGKYIIAADNGPRVTIPNLRFKNTDYKATEIFQGIHSLPDGISNAVHEVIKVWVDIAKTAERLDNDSADPNSVKALKRKTVKLNEARQAFETMAFLCNQLLDEPKFWDQDSLLKFASDPDWNEYLPVLHELHAHYYPQD